MTAPPPLFSRAIHNPSWPQSQTTLLLSQTEDMHNGGRESVHCTVDTDKTARTKNWGIKKQKTATYGKKQKTARLGLEPEGAWRYVRTGEQGEEEERPPCPCQSVNLSLLVTVPMARKCFFREQIFFWQIQPCFARPLKWAT